MAAESAPAYVNAYVAGSKADKLILLRRDGATLRREERDAEYVSYHRATDLTPIARRWLENVDGLIGLRPEGRWFRAVWQSFDWRRHAIQVDGLLERNGIPHYEADVHPVKRFLVDSGARIQKPRRAYLDIETDSRLSFARLRAGEGRVLCWTIVDELGKAESRCLEADTDAAERALLIHLVRHLENFDQVAAWNGDGFDFLVLRGDRRAKTEGRFRRLNIQFFARQWLWIDHLTLFKRMNLQVAESGDEKQSHKLQDIAMSLLGEGKDDFDSSKTWDAWVSYDRDRLVRYNARDTDLLRRIEEKTGYLALLDTICDACGVFPDSRGMRPLNQLDPFMLRLGRSRDMHFPTVTRFESEDDRKKFKGAYVMEPTFIGIVRNVHVCDFKSLYPSIIISWNMSPETKVLGSRNSIGPMPGCARAPGTDVQFRIEPQGLLPLAVSEMLRLRTDWKAKKASLPPGTPEWVDADRKSNAYKVASNSFFGGMGNEFSRFFDVDVAESITQAGVYLIHAVVDAAQDAGWNPGYCDTDGAYITGNPDRAIFGSFVKDTLNGSVIPKVLTEHGCIERRVSISYEKQFDRIFFCGKKRYAARYLHYEGTNAKPDSKPEIKGLEFKRGDTAKLARQLQERVIRMLLGNWESPFQPPTEDAERYRNLIAKSRDFVLGAQLTREQVMVSKSVARSLGDYAVRTKKDGTDAAQPPHVQVAHMLAERGAEVAAGTKIAYVVIDGADAIKAIPADDYKGEFDRYYLWEKLVWPPVERVLSAALPGTDWHRMFGRVRPMKERPPLRGGAGPGQLNLGFDGVRAAPAVPMFVTRKAVPNAASG